ncbi:MAG: glycosyl transferase family 2 [Oscillospiraceae bacterium]|jgi:tetratricopeptide (TPR) repeat protein|nr:glycosyl transferase family 2 [Oscillospiraceae bacterium]
MRFKVCVYAICKNELKYIDDWVKSMSEADWICVLDTGSTDGTVERLRELGCIVGQQEVKPWRFDVARNLSMELIPAEADICVSTDMDEILEPGWREKLEQHWKPGSIQGRYRYTWNFNDDGTEGTVFLYDKIHCNHDFKWVNPVHEVLHYTGDAPHTMVALPGIQLNHYADPNKSRSQYLPLLELAVEENPNNDRNLHYLGREYMFYRRWNDAIEMLKRHLALPTSTWREERCASMRFIGRCYEGLGQQNSAMEYYWKAIAEAPALREPYVEMAKLLYRQEDWFGVLFIVDKVLKIRTRTGSYICEADAWGSLPYDIASMAFFHIGNIPMALNMARGAHDKAPLDARINKNIELFELLVQKQDEINERTAVAGIPSISIPERRLNSAAAYDLIGKDGAAATAADNILATYGGAEQRPSSERTLPTDTPAADLNTKAAFPQLSGSRKSGGDILSGDSVPAPSARPSCSDTLDGDTRAAMDAAAEASKSVEAMFAQ